MSELNLVELRGLVWVDPDRLSGAACFAGTRVPVQALLDHLEGGATIDEFLEGFPSVSRAQVVRLLEMATEQLVACASSSTSA